MSKASKLSMKKKWMNGLKEQWTTSQSSNRRIGCVQGFRRISTKSQKVIRLNSSLDNQPVLHLTDRLFPRLQNNQWNSKTDDLIKSAFGNQPFFYRRIVCVQGFTIINQNWSKWRKFRMRKFFDNQPIFLLRFGSVERQKLTLYNQPVLLQGDKLCQA